MIIHLHPFHPPLSSPDYNRCTNSLCFLCTERTVLGGAKMFYLYRGALDRRRTWYITSTNVVQLKVLKVKIFFIISKKLSYLSNLTFKLISLMLQGYCNNLLGNEGILQKHFLIIVITLFRWFFSIIINRLTRKNLQEKIFLTLNKQPNIFNKSCIIKCAW